MSCIYRKSKYYESAKLNPLDVCRPFGYQLKKEVEKERQKARQIKRLPIIFTKIITENSLMKQLSSKSQTSTELEKLLRIENATQRKNYCLNGVNLQIANNISPLYLQELQLSFIPGVSQKTKILQFLEVLNAIDVLKENLFRIRDYAISTFMMLYEGSDLQVYKHLVWYLKGALIEYNYEILINSPQLERPQLRRIDYSTKQNVEEYINEIMHLGKYKDKFFGGLHFYLCDHLPQNYNQGMLLQDQKRLWTYLNFHITVITGTLNDGQNACLKMAGSFTQKTIEYVYLLSLAFTRIYFYKYMGANAFSSQKYLVCEGFNRETGRIISRFLLNNFDEILNGKDNILMVPIKSVFQNNFYGTINDYNHSLSIFKIPKDTMKSMEINTFNFYPNREKLIAKLEQLQYALPWFQQIKKDMEEWIPLVDSKELDKAPLITEKKAETFDLEMMSKLVNPAAAKPKREKKDKELFDLKEEYPQTSYLQAVKHNKVNREKQKKEERIKKNEQPK